MRARLLVACVLAAPLLAWGDLEPGLWQLSVATSVAGAGQLSSTTSSQCLSAADARDPSRVFGGSNPACTFSDRRDSGGELSFNVSCGGAVPVRGSGRVRYGRDTLEAEMQLSGDAGGQKFATTSSISGRRTGPCQ